MCAYCDAEWRGVVAKKRAAVVSAVMRLLRHESYAPFASFAPFDRDGTHSIEDDSNSLCVCCRSAVARMTPFSSFPEKGFLI